MPLSGLGDDSLEGLRAAFSGLSVGGPEGKKKEKEKEAVDMGAEEVDPGDGHEPSPSKEMDPEATPPVRGDQRALGDFPPCILSLKAETITDTCSITCRGSLAVGCHVSASECMQTTRTIGRAGRQ